VKGKGFILIFSPHPGEILMAATGCLILCSVVFALKLLNRPSTTVSPARSEPEHSAHDRL
jgi:hypothetical protein